MPDRLPLKLRYLQLAEVTGGSAVGRTTTTRRLRDADRNGSAADCISKFPIWGAANPMDVFFVYSPPQIGSCPMGMIRTVVANSGSCMLSNRTLGHFSSSRVCVGIRCARIGRLRSRLSRSRLSVCWLDDCYLEHPYFSRSKSRLRWTLHQRLKRQLLA